MRERWRSLHSYFPLARQKYCLLRFVLVLLVVTSLLLQLRPVRESATTFGHRRNCPKLEVSSRGQWIIRKNNGTAVRSSDTSWTWQQPDGKSYVTTRTEPRQLSLSVLLQENSASLVFYGSSHLRELYLALIRLEQGSPYDAKLPPEITYIPSGTRYQDKECDPSGRGWVTGLLGVDLDKCGRPGKRMVPELGEKVAIGFKTFLHTPQADAEFIEFLSEHGMRNPDVLLCDIGIWGLRGNKLGGWVNYTMTPQQELDYYLHFLRSSFPSSKIVVLYEDLPSNPELQESILVGIQNMATASEASTSIIILRKDHLLHTKPQEMPCGHGCAGPVMNTVALIFVEWLAQALTGVTQCIF